MKSCVPVEEQRIVVTFSFGPTIKSSHISKMVSQCELEMKSSQKLSVEEL
jgi:hypothetical protein